MTRHRITDMADRVDALEQELEALCASNPEDPGVPRLQERLHQALERMYRAVPRGV